MPTRIRSRIQQLSTQLQLAMVGLFVLLPVVWMLRLAFEGGVGGRPDDAALWPQVWTWANLQRAWEEPRGDTTFLLLLGNSLVAALGTTAVALAFGAGAAYAFARYRFPGRRAGLFASLVLATLPPAGLGAPFFFYLSSLGLRRSLLGLVLVYSAIAVPFAIWTLRTAVQQIDRDVEDAAMLEGASAWQIYTRITLPLIAPTIAAAGFIAFLIAWSEYALAWALISDPKLVTLAMAINSMRDLSQVSWGLLSATALLTALPVLILFYSLGNAVLDGLSFGAEGRRGP